MWKPQRLRKTLRSTKLFRGSDPFFNGLLADEVFSTGNHGKVVPCLRYEDQAFAAGPLARKARDLYWEFAHQGDAITQPPAAVSAC